MRALFRAGNRLKALGWLLLGLVLLILAGLYAAGSLFSLPHVDEVRYTLHALKMAQGALPYRDFYEAMMPGGLVIVAMLMKLTGFSSLGIVGVLNVRLWVMLGWLAEMLLIYKMGKRHLSSVWMGLLLGFLWIVDARFPFNQSYFWSGLLALAAVYLSWRALHSVYAGNVKPRFLVGCGVLCGICFWITPSVGVMISLGLGVSGLLHCFLHEREERGVGYRQVSNWDVFKRWGRTWGLTWALPSLMVHGLCIAALVMLGIWPAFCRDAGQWFGVATYQNWGYFTTFSQEVAETLRPLIERTNHVQSRLTLFGIPMALNLLMLGVLPVLGLLSTGYLLPNRFVYRLLQRGDEELLLFWISALSLILASMTDCTAMHLVSIGGLAFFLGWLAMARWFARRHKMERPAQIGIALLLVAMMLSVAMPFVALILATR